MKLTTGYKKPIASSGDDALELSSNNSYLLLAGGGHKALSELVSPADLTNYVTIGSDLTITGVKTFSLAINADITGNADTVDGYHADDILPYGLENLCVGAVKSGGQTILNSDGSITTSGNNADTYFFVRCTEDLKAGLIYTVGFYVTGVPSGNTETWEWPFAGQTNSNLVLHIKSNGWCWGTGTIPNDVTAGTDIIFDDGYHGFWSSINISKFVIVKGRQKAYYTPPISKMSVNYATSAGNADTCDGLHVNTDYRNTEANKIVHTDDNGYLQCGYINSSYGDEGNNSSPARVWGTNGSDSYLRTYLTSALSVGYLRGRDPNGVYFGDETYSNIIAEWNTKSDNRWYLKAASTHQCRVEYADKASEANKVYWSNIENKPVDTVGDAQLVIQVNGTKIIPTGGDFSANKSGDVSIYNIPIGNGRLILKNGNTIISDNFTANKGDDTTIDLNSTFTNKSDFELLGSKVDKIDTSIAGLNTATHVDTPFNDAEDDDENNIEIVDDPYKNAKELGSVTLKFWNLNKTYTLPVYDVLVLPLATVKEPIGTLSYYCEIFLVIGITGSSIMDDIGFTSGSYKYFYIRGANKNNKVCETFDVRGNGNTNTANACITGGYLHLQCSLKLHGGDSGTGNDIMQKAAEGGFSAYFCLRQTP